MEEKQSFPQDSDRLHYIRRTAEELQPSPGIDEHALALEAAEAFWAAREGESDVEIAAETAQLARLANSWLMAPVREFLIDFAGSVVPASLMAGVGYLLLARSAGTTAWPF